MKNFKVGLQVYSVRDELAKDFEGTLKKVKEIGYDYVEFAGFYDKTAEEVKAIIDKIGLNAISVHQGNQLFAQKGMEAVDDLKTVGVKYCAIPWYESAKLKNNWEETKADFTEFSKALKSEGIKLLYHNHDFEFEKVDGEYIIDRMYREMPSGIIDPEFDTCWVHYSGEDPCKYIEKYAGRVEVLHLKDFVCKNLASGPVYALISNDGGEEKKASKEDNGFRFTPLGAGIQDFPAILASAEKSGTEYIIVEQDESVDMPPMEAAKISRDYLKSLGI